MTLYLGIGAENREGEEGRNTNPLTLYWVSRLSVRSEHLGNKTIVTA